MSFPGVPFSFLRVLTNSVRGITSVQDNSVTFEIAGFLKFYQIQHLLLKLSSVVYAEPFIGSLAACIRDSTTKEAASFVAQI